MHVQLAGQFINRLHLVDLDYRTDFGDQRVVRAPVQVRLLVNQNKVFANPLGFVGSHDVFDAHCFCFTRTSDDAGPATNIGDNADRTPSKRGITQLLDRRKEAVKVQIKMFDCIWLAHEIAESGKGL